MCVVPGGGEVLKSSPSGVLEGHRGQAWWHKPLIPALGRQRQEDLSKFKTNLVYIDPDSKKKKKKSRLQSSIPNLSHKTSPRIGSQ
jgi:hypothetical protein